LIGDIESTAPTTLKMKTRKKNGLISAKHPLLSYANYTENGAIMIYKVPSQRDCTVTLQILRGKHQIEYAISTTRAGSSNHYIKRLNTIFQ